MSQPQVQTVLSAPVFEAEAVAKSFVDFDLGTSMCETARPVIIAAFKDASFDAFNGRRSMLIDKFVASGKTPDAAQKLFERTIQALDITKPKSVNPEAVKKAEQREAAKKAETAKIIELKPKKLEELVSLAASGDKIAQKAVEQRIAESAKAADASIKTQRAAVLEQVKNSSKERIEVASLAVGQADFFHDIICMMRLAGEKAKLSAFDDKIKAEVIKAIEGKLKVKVVKADKK